jgi:hypothetical protein
MPQNTLRVQVRNEFKDGIVVYASAPQQINIDDIIDIYGPNGNVMRFAENITSGMFRFFKFYTGSANFKILGSQNSYGTRLIDHNTFVAGVYDVTYRIEDYYHVTSNTANEPSRIANAEYFQLRFIVKGTPEFGPEIYTDANLPGLFTNYGKASENASFKVSAKYLDAPIAITAPTGFQVSSNSLNGYKSSINVGKAGDLSEVPIYLRLSPTAPAGTYSGNITLSSTGATTLTVSTSESEIYKLSQTINSLGAISSKVEGAAPFLVAIPNATSMLPVTLSVKTGPATITGNTVTLTGPGTVVIAANQAGNTNYNAAPEVTSSFTVAAVAPPSSIIRNGNMQMDVGVSRNIKITYNSVFQEVYVRVTGLPAGMKYNISPDGSLNSSISGAPLASGTYNVTIETSYKTSETSETLNTTKTIVYTVNPVSNPAILLADQNLTSGISVNLPLRASDASHIVSWAATGLPAGLASGTGIDAAITGTPTTAGTFNSTITLVCRKINSTENTTITKPVTFTIS